MGLVNDMHMDIYYINHHNCNRSKSDIHHVIWDMFNIIINTFQKWYELCANDELFMLGCIVEFFTPGTGKKRKGVLRKYSYDINNGWSY